MKRALTWTSRALVAFGVVAVPGSLYGGELLRTALVGFAVIALLIGVGVAWRIHKFPTTFITVLSLFGIAYATSAVIGGVVDSDDAVLITTPIDLGATALLIGALGFVVRQRRGRFSTGDVLDGLIIGLGGWLVAWITLIQPFIELDEYPPLGLVLNALYLPMCAPVLALAATLVFSNSRRGPSTWLIVTGVTMSVIGDAVYAVFEVGHTGVWAVNLADSLYVVAFSWAAAGLLHPSAPELVRARNTQARLNLPGRVAVTGLSLVVPMVLVALVAAPTFSDRVVRAVSSLAILAMASLRLASATRSHLIAQERLIDAARTDALTSLPNRAALLDCADTAIEAAWRTDRLPSVYLIDIDRFKNTNDSLGHAAGDEALKLIATRLFEVAARLGATLGRPSGDEFVIVDPDTLSTGEALAHAELFQDALNTPLSLDAGVMFMTASIGVATMPIGRDVSAADLLRQADIAMYRAKDAGRNCLALYHDSMQQRLTQRMKVETALHSALDNREMRLYHQPIVDSSTGHVCGFEALIRWQRSDGSIMSPAEFIPVAEETGIITSIGAWALLEALTQLRTWIDEGVVSDTTTVSVNVSARQLADPSFCDVVDEAIRRSELPPHLLWLEVTESMMIENPELARNTLQRIRTTGVRIALDDFGTGYSSLSLLQRFPIQRIKIDRAFVSGIAENANDRSLVRTIVAMGGSMGLDIVGEGVETVQQLKMLRELGCAKAQGYLISHPVPAEAMRSTIAALESLSQWEAFDDVLGDRPDRPTRLHRP